MENCVSVRRKEIVSRDYVGRIMSDENDWDRNVEGDAEEGPVVCVSREEVLQALNEMKTINVPGPSEVPLELIAASGGVRIYVTDEMSRRWIWNAS